MKKNANPAMIAGAVVLLLALLGFIGYKVLTPEQTTLTQQERQKYYVDGKPDSQQSGGKGTYPGANGRGGQNPGGYPGGGSGYPAGGSGYPAGGGGYPRSR